MNTALAEQHAEHKARRARINAPRFVVEKPRNRPFAPTIWLEIAKAQREADLEREIAEFEAAEKERRRLQILRQTHRIVRIIMAVSEECGVAVGSIRSTSRRAKVVRARQIGMYLSKLEGFSFLDIGQRFGGRDHSTAVHAVQKIAVLIETDAETAKRIARIGALLEVAP